MTTKFEFKRRLTQSFRKVSLKLGDLGQTRIDSTGMPEPPATPSEPDTKDFFSISFEEHTPYDDVSSVDVHTRDSRSHSEASMMSEHFPNRTDSLAPMTTPISPSSRSDSIASPQIIRPGTTGKDAMGPPLSNNGMPRSFGSVLPASPESHSIAASEPSVTPEETLAQEEAAAEAAAAHADIAAEKIALDILNKVQDQRSEKEGWTI